MIKYKYCPECRNSLTSKGQDYHCKNCGLVLYIDPKPCVSALPVKDGKVLLCKRAVEPHKGAYDVIGGFMKAGENAEEAIKREVKEETGLEIKILKLLGSYPDQYGEGGDYVIAFQFIVEIVSGIPNASDDVSALEWVPIENLPELNGFKNTRETLKDLQKWYKEVPKND